MTYEGKAKNIEKNNFINNADDATRHRAVLWEGKVLTESQESSKFCSNCGAKINSKAVICPNCGVRQQIGGEEVSSLWYLVPLFFGFIGGIVA